MSSPNSFAHQGTASDEQRLELLRTEGLELLRYFHAIEDAALRCSLLQVMKTVSTSPDAVVATRSEPLRFPRR